jgi:taurine dioxygenase
MSGLQVRRLAYALGAEVRGVDLSAELDDATVAAIRAAWLEHIVLRFPEQDLGPEQLMRFSARFGELDDNRSSPFARHPDFEAVVARANMQIEVNGKKVGGFGRGDKWHSDRSQTDRPASASLLLAKQLPDIGGDTMWANAYMAYETLSPAMQRMLEPLEGVYDVSLATSFSHGSAQVREELARLNPPVLHPIVHLHPETKRKSLFIGDRLSHIEGMTPEESRPILDFLMQHATRYEFIYRHVWRLNDLFMWDNRCSLHLAIQDYDDSQVRHMLKCVVLSSRTGRYANEERQAAVAR